MKGRWILTAVLSLAMASAVLAGEAEAREPDVMATKGGTEMGKDKAIGTKWLSWLPGRIAPGPALSDVCMSVRSKRGGAQGERDMENVRAFAPTRMEWVYTRDAQWIAQLHSAGIGYVESTVNTIMRQGGRTVAIDGEPLVAPWMVAFDRKNPVYWACSNDPEYRVAILDAAVEGIQAGADGIQCDDWRMVRASTGWGGCFCKPCMKGFREYLDGELGKADLAGLGIDDIELFDYGEHLKAQGIDSKKKYLESYRSLPLTGHFIDFQVQSVRKFFKEFRQKLNERTGREVPLSVNTCITPVQSGNFIMDIIDYGLGEGGRFSALGSIAVTARTADALGKRQVISPMPKSVGEARAGLVITYASGHLFLVPYDIYMGSNAEGISPRYYGKVEEYADLYRFIQKYPELFDGYASPASVGVLINTDTCDMKALSALSERMIQKGNLFGFILCGQKYLDLDVTPERLKGFEAIIAFSPVNGLQEDERAVINSVGINIVESVTDEWLDEMSLIRVEGASDVLALPRVSKAGSIVCHLLNQNDGLGAREVSVSLSTSLLANAESAKLFQPGVAPQDLECTVDTERITVTVSKLAEWAILRFE